jgi:plasmid stabilization system protein ParE
LNRVSIQPAAIADMAEAASWYESQLVDLGIEFILEIDAAIDRAAEAPEIYEELYPGVRRVLAHRFPYSVYFVFESSVVEVIAVLHQHQSPGNWQSRI